MMGRFRRGALASYNIVETTSTIISLGTGTGIQRVLDGGVSLRSTYLFREKMIRTIAARVVEEVFGWFIIRLNGLQNDN